MALEAVEFAGNMEKALNLAFRDEGITFIIHGGNVLMHEGCPTGMQAVVLTAAPAYGEVSLFRAEKIIASVLQQAGSKVFVDMEGNFYIGNFNLLRIRELYGANPSHTRGIFAYGCDHHSQIRRIKDDDFFFVRKTRDGERTIPIRLAVATDFE